MSYPRVILDYLIDLIFPYRCVVCRKYLEHEYLCERCFNALPIKKQNECIGCQRATPFGKTCAFCREAYAVDTLLIVSDFKDRNVASIIRFFKYRFLKDLSEPLSKLTVKYLDHLAKRDHFSVVQGAPLLVPVPLHKTREYWRGFNQSELLARAISRHYQLDFSNQLIRPAQATPQVELENRSERLLNVEGLYSCSGSEIFKGRNIILMDDVCTTGATFNECARVLKNAGAVSVTALAVARG